VSPTHIAAAPHRCRLLHHHGQRQTAVRMREIFDLAVNGSELLRLGAWRWSGDAERCSLHPQPVLHHEPDRLERADVSRRVAGHCDQVGEVPGGDPA
jgi:hypothetical protein